MRPHRLCFGASFVIVEFAGGFRGAGRSRVALGAGLDCARGAALGAFTVGADDFGAAYERAGVAGREYDGAFGRVDKLGL